jgi:hypothetical protein
MRKIEADRRRRVMAGKVGQTMSMHTDEVGDSQPGCGFIITDDRGKSCIAIAYATSAEADAAAEKIRETLTSAIWTRCQNDLRK